MNIHTLPDGSIKISEHFGLARFGLLAFTVLVATGVGYGWLGGIAIFQPAYGWLIGAAATFGLAALLEDRDIEFNLPLRRVRWQQRRLFTKKDGNIPMDAVKDIVLCIVGTDDSLNRRPQYRLMMVTREETIPLTNTHTTDKNELEQAAESLLAVLSREPSDDITDRSLNDAVAQGRTVEATRWLRLRDGLDLTSARKIADAMKEKKIR
ncbi:MAG: hypothetical protein KGZ80_06415 [Methylomonas sp.]|nr:hypothetical protein [Methylomonas sp.]